MESPLRSLTPIFQSGSEDHSDLLDREAFPDWDYEPGEDGDPFEPKASDWGRIGGRLVALDYSMPVYDTKEERDAQIREALAKWDELDDAH